MGMSQQQLQKRSRSSGLLQLLASVVVLFSGCCCCLAAAAGACPAKERAALLRLRDSIYHPRPANLSEWPTWVGEDCCGWQGVSCGQDAAAPRRVVAVSLPPRRRRPELGGMVVNGSLFAALEELQDLDLTDNRISKWIQPEGMLGLKKLKSVYLRENLLSDESVSWLFDLPSLVEVDLSDNKLKSSSSVLKGFCKLEKLATLKLDRNEMEGTIDPCVVHMPSLQLLSLHGNRLAGEIPPLGKRPTLTGVSLGANRLSGVFYLSSIANLANLTGISLMDNPGLEVETEHPTGWVPSFQLAGLALSGCRLNRRSGGGIPSFLSTQKRMQLLALSRTSIRGPIPAWLLDVVSDGLLLDGNDLSGPFPRPEGNGSSTLSLLDLSKNKIHGPIPANMKSLLPGLYHVNLSRNAFAGGMASFGQLGYLGVLDLSHNGLTGEIPAELTAKDTRLSHLRLSHNRLEGRMLPPGSAMGRLRYLALENNRLTGPISPDLANSPSLIILNLRGNLLSGALPPELFALPDLAVVLLSGNKFRGPIPAQLCAMKGLRMLDLSANSFSGAIPGCLSTVASWRINSSAQINQNYYGAETVEAEFWTKGRLQSIRGDDLNFFTGVDLSRNQLTGSIPAEMGAMAALRSLNISRNLISGGIPSSLQGLELIESLDLSHNQLTGSVPPQIARLRHLSVFCAAHNKLSGRINPIGAGHLSSRCS